MLTITYYLLAAAVMIGVLVIVANVVAWNLEEWNGGEGE
jgi:hypothetical protein